LSTLNRSQHSTKESENRSKNRAEKDQVVRAKRAVPQSTSPAEHQEFEITADQAALEDSSLEESLRTLRFAESPMQRVAAAQILGQIRSRLATANLVAALFDGDAEVRAAAAQALDEIGDPSVAIGPMHALMGNQPEALQATPAQTDEAEVLSGEAMVEELDDVIAAFDYEPLGQISQIDVQHLLDQENAARDAVADLQSQLVGIEVAKASADSEMRLSAEREARLQAAVTALAGEEKELRDRADEIAGRRIEVSEELRSVLTARSETEHKAENLRKESDRLRHEAEQLISLAEQYTREIVRAEAAQKQAVFALEHAEARQSLQQAEALHRSEFERLESEEEQLHRALEQLTLSRVEVDAARQDAEKQSLQLQEKRAELDFAEAKRREEIQQTIRAAEAREQNEREELRKSEEALRETVEQIELRRAQIEFALQEARDSASRLSEVQARIQAAEDARRQDEAEYARLESETSQQAQEATRKLEAFRIRFQEEQQRLEEQAAQTAAEEERRMAELDNFRKQLEAEARRRSNREKSIQAEIQQLLNTEAEHRDQIEKAAAKLREMEEQRRAAEEEARAELAQQEHEYELRRKANAETRLKIEEEIRRRIAEEQQLKHEAEEAIRQLKNDARRESEKRVQRVAQLETLRQQLATAAAAELAREEYLGTEIEQLQKEEQKLRLRIQSEARLRAQVEERVQQEKERFEAETSARQTAEQKTPLAGKVDRVRHITRRIPDLGTIAPDLPPEIIARLNSRDSRAAAVADLPRAAVKDAFNLIVQFFDDPSAEVRNAAAVALSELTDLGPVEAFTRAVEAASRERQRNIGTAMAGSGVAARAIQQLGSEKREDNYNALCLLFTMAKTGEIKPLVEAIERHEEVQVRRAAIRLLNLIGQPEIANAAAKRRLSIVTD